MADKSSYMVRRGRRYLIERTADGTFGRFISVGKKKSKKSASQKAGAKKAPKKSPKKKSKRGPGRPRNKK